MPQSTNELRFLVQDGELTLDGVSYGRLVELVVQDGRILEVVADWNELGEATFADAADGQLELLDPRRGVLPAVENSNVNSNSNVKSKEAFGQEVRESPEVSEVWELYGQLISSRRRLGATQRRDIERALALRDLATVKQAVVGLSKSPHHNGRNDTGTKYLDIRYALRGNGQRGESNEERIDRMAELAGSGPTPSPASQASLRPRRNQQEVDRLLRSIRHEARRPPYPTDLQDIVEDLEGERLQRRDQLTDELRERFGVIATFAGDSDPDPDFRDE